MNTRIETTRDVASRIRRQHDTIRDLFGEVQRAAGEERARAFEPLVRLLSVHETAEEMTVYPRLSMTGPEGLAIVRARKREEDEAKKALAELESMDPSGEAFDAAFRRFRADVEEHADLEESEVLPRLERHVAPLERRLMEFGFVAAQFVAPTHAHRMAPESALGNLLVGPLVGTIDRVRDVVRDARR